MPRTRIFALETRALTRSLSFSPSPRRIRHKFIREHSTLQPEDLEETESVATTTMSSIFPQPEKHWSTELSKYRWRNCNPGYILKTQQVPSTTNDHFSYDKEEVSSLPQQALYFLCLCVCVCVCFFVCSGRRDHTAHSFSLTTCISSSLRFNSTRRTGCLVRFTTGGGMRSQSTWSPLLGTSF